MMKTLLMIMSKLPHMFLITSLASLLLMAPTSELTDGDVFVPIVIALLSSGLTGNISNHRQYRGV